MWTRRDFLSRSTAALLGAAGAGALYAVGQEAGENGAFERGMITAETQRAIDRGLDYLVRNQHGQGRTRGAFGTGRYHGDIAVSSLGGLAFMAAGSQPGRGPYGRNITRALEYVISQETPFHNGGRTPGFLFHGGQGPMYGHGFGTLFLAEAHGMVHDRDLRDRLRGTLQRAVQLIIRSQNQEGGWRYQPHSQDADISVTICQIMALRAARNAGISVPRAVADNCIRYVRNCQSFDGGFRYRQHGGGTGFARTAAGVVALYSAGVYRGQEIDRGLRYLMERCRPGALQNGWGGFHQEVEMHFYYGHYYAVQAMWIAGGRYWREWFPAIREELLRRQRQDGSWFDMRICPHYCTAMACIILQIPNNFLPIFQR